MMCVSQHLYLFWCCTWPHPWLSPGVCDAARLLLSAPGPAAEPAPLVLSTHKPATARKQQWSEYHKSDTNVTRKVVNQDLLLDAGAFAEHLVYNNFEGFGQEELSFWVIDERLFRVKGTGWFLWHPVCCWWNSLNNSNNSVLRRNALSYSHWNMSAIAGGFKSRYVYLTSLSWKWGQQKRTTKVIERWVREHGNLWTRSRNCGAMSLLLCNTWQEWPDNT